MSTVCMLHGFRVSNSKMHKREGALDPCTESCLAVAKWDRYSRVAFSYWDTHQCGMQMGDALVTSAAVKVGKETRVRGTNH